MGVAMGDVVGPRHRRRRADGPAPPRDARLRARGPLAGRRARPARPRGAQPRRRPDGHAALPRRGAGPRHRALRERGPRAAARDQPGRRGRLPRERAEPAARRVREPGPQRDRAPSSRPGPRSCSTRTGSWRSAACRSTTGSRRSGWRPPRTPATRTSCASGWWTRCSRSTRPNDDIAVLALRALPTAPPPLHLEMPSDPTRARPDAPRPGQLAARARAPPARWSRSIQMACHEACSNSIEHGYSFGDGRALGRRRARGRGRVVLTVRDKGHWIERGPRRPAALPRQRPAADAGADGLGGADARERERDGGEDGAEPVSRQSCSRRVTNDGIEGVPPGGRVCPPIAD